MGLETAICKLGEEGAAGPLGALDRRLGADSPCRWWRSWMWSFLACLSSTGLEPVQAAVGRMALELLRFILVAGVPVRVDGNEDVDKDKAESNSARSNSSKA